MLPDNIEKTFMTGSRVHPSCAVLVDRIMTFMLCYNSQGYYDDDIARMKERFGIPVDITVSIKDVIERYGHKLDHYEWIMCNVATEYDGCEKHLDDGQKYAMQSSIVSIEYD